MWMLAVVRDAIAAKRVLLVFGKIPRNAKRMPLVVSRKSPRNSVRIRPPPTSLGVTGGHRLGTDAP
jgi:hypothetical protein